MLEVSLQLAENVDVGRERPLTEVNTIDTVPSLIFRCGGTISITTPPHSTPEQWAPGTGYTSCHPLQWYFVFILMLFLGVTKDLIWCRFFWRHPFQWCLYWCHLFLGWLLNNFVPTFPMILILYFGVNFSVLTLFFCYHCFMKGRPWWCWWGSDL